MKSAGAVPDYAKAWGTRMTSATRKRAAFSGLALALAAAWPSAAVETGSITWPSAAVETGSITGTAAPIACGTIYEAQRGDWLHKIAVRAYGEANYLAIYQANRDVLLDESSLTVGVQLLIPCLDGTGPSTRAEAKAMGMLDDPSAEAKFVVAPLVAATAPAVSNPVPEVGAAAETGSVTGTVAPITCGTIYEAQRGDWLHKIAVRAYGKANYLAIYQANRDVLLDKSSLTVGTRLLIPCLDGTWPSTRAEAKATGMLDDPSAEAKFVAAPVVAATAPAVSNPVPEVSAAAETGSVTETVAPIACGTIYEAQWGDWLRKIAARAYGEANYFAIYQANRDILPGISSLTVGARLLIPCLDGTGPSTRAEAKAMGMLDDPSAEAEFVAAPVVAATAPAVSAPLPEVGASLVEASTPVPEISLAAVVADTPGIGLLSGPDFAPFADPRLPKGGMIAELVTLSLARAAPDRPARLSFVDDWSLHLGLLDSGEFDIGFPWYKPDCTRADRLTGTMRERCTGFVFSNPLYEVDMGFYVQAGDPLAEATAPEALFGKRICRPAGYFTFDLEQAELFEPNVTRVIPPAAADCFAWLARGDVDVVSVSVLAAADGISQLGLDGRVVPVAALASSQTLHVIAPEGNAEGRAYIDLVNEGLTELQISGRWFEVVSRHLGAYVISTR